MACELDIINGDMTLDCADIPVGGLQEVFVVRLDDVSGVVSADGEVSDLTIVDVVNLEFNMKDGYSNFTDGKTVDDSGVVTATPTVTLEFPKMTLSKRNAIEKLTANTELVLFINTASGIKHVAGLDFGMYGSEANGQSGAGRSDKNSYNITFTGEEINLSMTVSDAAWAKVLTALI